MEGKEYKEADIQQEAEQENTEPVEESDLVPELETEDTPEPEQEPKEHTYGRNTRADALVPRMIELKCRGLTNEEISRAVAVPKRTVSKRLFRFREVFKSLRDVKNHQKYNGVFLRAAEFQLLKEIMSPDKLAKATIHNLAFAMDKIHAMRRLEEGKSTANISQQIFTRPTTSTFNKS